MANEKRGLRGLLTLRDAARLLELLPDELLVMPGIVQIVIDLKGPRKLNPDRLEEEDYDDLRVREADLEDWLAGRTGAAAAAGAGA